MAVMPKMFLIWSITSRLPAPNVKPTITEWEMKRVRSPSLNRQMPSWMQPIMKLMRTTAASRSSGGVIAATALSTAIEIALVGPLMSCREESNNAPIAVMTIAV